MKKITTLLLAALFSFTGVAQDKINWLTTSEFEKAIKKEKQNVFIFIEDDRVNENMPKERAEEMQKRMFAFLEDEQVVAHINKNFICYKFNPATESVNFQGKEYKQIEGRGSLSNEFVIFLTGSKRSRLPAIVLRDEKFELFQYKKSAPNIEELTILLEAEKLKNNYISEKLDKGSPAARRSAMMLEQQEKQLEKAKESSTIPSVLAGERQKPDRLLKTLTYFSTGANQKIDLNSYLRNK